MSTSSMSIPSPPDLLFASSHSMGNFVTRGLSARMLRTSLPGGGGGWCEQGRGGGEGADMRRRCIPGQRQPCVTQQANPPGLATWSGPPASALVELRRLGRLLPHEIVLVLGVDIIPNPDELLKERGGGVEARAVVHYLAPATRGRSRLGRSSCPGAEEKEGARPVPHLAPIGACEEDDCHAHDVAGRDAGKVGRVRLQGEQVPVGPWLLPTRQPRAQASKPAAGGSWIGSLIHPVPPTSVAGSPPAHARTWNTNRYCPGATGPTYTMSRTWSYFSDSADPT